MVDERDDSELRLVVMAVRAAAEVQPVPDLGAEADLGRVMPWAQSQRTSQLDESSPSCRS